MKLSNFSVCCVALQMLVMALTVTAQEKSTNTTKLTGQLVCSLCWSEADRKTTPYGTAADIECAKECAGKGIPTALAVKDGEDIKLYVISFGRFKKTSAEFLDYIGKYAEVEGRTKRNGDKDYVEVDDLKLLPDQSQNVNQTKVIGAEVDLALKDLFGVDQKLSGYHGKIIVLNFWATWCIPCRKEMPDLAAIQNEYAAFGVQTIGATADQISEQSKVVQFIKQARINFPVWVGATTTEMGAFGVGPALPATAIVGRDGKIVFVKAGPITRSELKKELDKLLRPDLQAIARRSPGTSEASQSSLVPS